MSHVIFYSFNCFFHFSGWSYLDSTFLKDKEVAYRNNRLHIVHIDMFENKANYNKYMCYYMNICLSYLKGMK